jgi:glutaredoxin
MLYILEKCIGVGHQQHTVVILNRKKCPFCQRISQEIVRCETCNYGNLDIKKSGPVCRNCFNQLVFASNMILEKTELNEADVDSDPENIAEVIKKPNVIDFTLSVSEVEDVQIINVSKPSASPRDTVSECTPGLEELERQDTQSLKT